MQQLLLPTKISFVEGKKPHEGQLIVEPCEAGFGTTLGNALRRVLLSSLPGAAITDIKINGVSHEFSAIEGVKEDAVEILLNLKRVRLKIFTDEPVRLSLSVKGEKEVTAGDIAKHADATVVNPSLHIATLTTKDATLTMELIAKRGRGYDPVESREKDNAEIGLLALDALYTPVRNVGFQVEHVRVGQMTNYDRLTLTVETDGTLTAQEAVEQASKILIDHFGLFTALAQVPEEVKGEEEKIEETPSEETAVVAEEGANEELAVEEPAKKSAKKKKEE